MMASKTCKITRFSLFLGLVCALLSGCLITGNAPTQSAPPVNRGAATGAYWPTQDWRSSTPEEQDMDSGRLKQALDSIQQTRLNLYSLLVIRNGTIVSENYFHGDTRDTRREIYSCTKSFTATLIGIAIDQGLIAGIDRPVLEFFPGRTFENMDGRKQAMTLKNLLTMTSGLDWNEGDAAYSQLYRSGDWVKFMLDLPMRAQPGAQFNYCSGCTHVLSAILQQKTGLNASQFARQNLFAPLGITAYRWDSDSQGIPIGGWGLQLTPREMAKLGYLYLHQGKWEDQQIVSAGWVDFATQKHTATDGNLGYGFQWWTYPKYGAYTALGRYGQTIFVVPNLNLVIVTTAQFEGGHDPIYQLIDNYIIPAVK
jgi:CubicO group peptidase (beta-lactamase class C family)